ncbi:endonuclease domain-containing protein [Streptomyces sp. NPDC048304]|uniref:endonuclease domain-containing protein n=1 Tax=Streptomyces sp. NPDC048304 TaxID=3154820 RepID=UPI00340D7CC6
MTTDERVCGRPAKKGTPCKRELHSWLEGLQIRRADGCWRHMGPLFKQAAQARQQADEEARLAFLYADPICWGWPVPNGLDGWMASQSKTFDELLVEQALGRALDSLDDKASALLAHWQDGRCAICGHRRSLIEDHDHATGMTRGWLCQGCNVQEGMYRDRDNLFGKYRERHPTKMLGLKIRYWDPIAKDYAQPAVSNVEADKWTDAASEGIGL